MKTAAWRGIETRHGGIWRVSRIRNGGESGEKRKKDKAKWHENRGGIEINSASVKA
jgi:hypothetical protein